MLHDVPRTATLGRYTFPTRGDYLTWCGRGQTVDELADATIIAIQRDWHMRGQNGCVFAMHAARILTHGQWQCDVYRHRPDAPVIRRAIEAAISDPGNQILSLLFPDVTHSDDLRVVVDLARSAGCRQAAEVDGRSGLVSLRYPVGGAESWIVGFAPLTTLPATRRAPFAELAIRTKPKSRPAHPELNGDASQAHLADVDLGFEPGLVSRLISKSTDRTAKVLGGKSCRNENKGAKAKVTFDLPTAC